MTNEEWKKVEEELKHLHSIVKLNCDGYDVSIMLQRISQFKNGIVVYINGVFKGEWLGKECEESRRFLRKVTRSLLTREQQKKYNKLSKKMKAEMNIKTEYSYYQAHWTSFNSLKKHLISQNSSIELVE